MVASSHVLFNPRENVPNGYIAVGWLLFLQEQIKVVIITKLRTLWHCRAIIFGVPRIPRWRFLGDDTTWISTSSSTMMMSFICSCRKKNQPKAIYPKGTSHHTRLFRGPSTNGMKKKDGPSRSWPTPHTTPFFLPLEDPSPVLLRPDSIPE